MGRNERELLERTVEEVARRLENDFGAGGHDSARTVSLMIGRVRDLKHDRAFHQAVHP